MAIEVTVITQPVQQLYGLWGKSSDKAIAKDIPALSKRYYEAIDRAAGSVLPFYVLSKNYDPAAGTFELFIGGRIEGKGLEGFQRPAGAYGRVLVRPKLGFLWGPAVGQAKREFYTQWLPGSGYRAANMEYELHTEVSVGKKPSIELLFAIEK